MDCCTAVTSDEFTTLLVTFTDASCANCSAGRKTDQKERERGRWTEQRRLSDEQRGACEMQRQGCCWADCRLRCSVRHPAWTL